MPTETKAVVVIPARWGSVRFPGKPLAMIGNRPMIQWVVEGARRAQSISEVIVATDDARIQQAVNDFGGRVVMTGSHHVSGSDRIAEVAAELTCDIVVNVQGDEPMIAPDNIDRVIGLLETNDEALVSTLMVPIESMEEVLDPDIVKVVTDQRGRALYFTRAPIPYQRDAWPEGIPSLEGHSGRLTVSNMFKHVGLYAYRRQFLLEFTRMPPTPLEKLEKLEQLRILENGIPIQIALTRFNSIGVDRKEDLVKIERLLARSGA